MPDPSPKFFREDDEDVPINEVPTTSEIKTPKASHGRQEPPDDIEPVDKRPSASPNIEEIKMRCLDGKYESGDKNSSDKKSDNRDKRKRRKGLPDADATNYSRDHTQKIIQSVIPSHPHSQHFQVTLVSVITQLKTLSINAPTLSIPYEYVVPQTTSDQTLRNIEYNHGLCLTDLRDKIENAVRHLTIAATAVTKTGHQFYKQECYRAELNRQQDLKQDIKKIRQREVALRREKQILRLKLIASDHVTGNGLSDDESDAS